MPLIRRVGTVPALGGIGVVVSDRGVVALEIHAWPQQLPIRHRRDAVETGDHPIISAVFHHLESYILGRGRAFPIACDFTNLPPTMRAVLEAVRQIPYGQTRTLAQLASRIANATVPVLRDALARNPLPILVPCHRAVEDTHLGVFVGPLAGKRQLLAIEGAEASKLPDPPAGTGTTRIWR